MQTSYRVGDRVVITVDKHGVRPGPRAKNVSAARNGELYAYQVDKYWIVTEVRLDGTLLLRTRRGKTHELKATDQRLRKANFLEKWLYGKRFPELTSLSNVSSSRTANPTAA